MISNTNTGLFVYEGEWDNQKGPSGPGVIKTKRGVVKYKGQWKDGNPVGLLLWYVAGSKKLELHLPEDYVPSFVHEDDDEEDGILWAGAPTCQAEDFDSQGRTIYKGQVEYIIDQVIPSADQVQFTVFFRYSGPGIQSIYTHRGDRITKEGNFYRGWVCGECTISENDQVIYQGQVLNGILHGLGTSFYGGEVQRYGYWNDGLEVDEVSEFEEVIGFPPVVLGPELIIVPREIWQRSQELSVGPSQYSDDDIYEPLVYSPERAPVLNYQVLRPEDVPRDLLCPICLDPFTPASKVVVTNCAHHICWTCLTSWVRSQTSRGPTCVVCRTELTDYVGRLQDRAD